MATTAMDYEAANGDRYEDEGPRYERDNRSASPRPVREDNEESRRRSASPNGNPDQYVSLFLYVTCLSCHYCFGVVKSIRSERPTNAVTLVLARKSLLGPNIMMTTTMVPSILGRTFL
jgi:hypothetical protein